MQVHYQYDAFVCYTTDDRFWVHSVLLKELEETYGFRLCIHYRDFGIGGSFYEMMVSKLSESRAVIFTLSESSLRSDWCMHELNIAYDQSVRLKKPLIIVKLGKITKKTVESPIFRQILDSRVYITWPGTGDEDAGKCNEMKQFWAKLTSGLYEETEGYLSCCRSYFGYRNLNDVGDVQGDQE
jgi:hypothetical protein